MIKIDPVAQQQVLVSHNQADVITNMETLIKGNIDVIDNNKQEIKKLQGLIKDSLSNDPTYQEHEKAAKEAIRIKNNTKAQLMSKPDLADLNQKLKDLKGENKSQQLSLFDYVAEYQRMANVNEIETNSGEIMEIIPTAKLVKKSRFF